MWTKSQKISVAVLGLAAVAFGVDRWVLPAPEAAAEDAASLVVSRAPAPVAAGAATPAAPGAAPAALPGAAAASEPIRIAQTVTLASRLAAIAQSRGFALDGSGDAFRPSDEWIEAAERLKNGDAKAPETAGAPAPAAPAKPAVRKVDHAAAFRKRHTLAAVMKKQDGGMAIVDGKLYAVGQSVDGFKLTQVGLADATFTGKGTKVTLRLPGQLQPPSPPVADAR